MNLIDRLKRSQEECRGNPPIKPSNGAEYLIWETMWCGTCGRADAVCHNEDDVGSVEDGWKLGPPEVNWMVCVGWEPAGRFYVPENQLGLFGEARTA
jgi:hypothetical protein